MNAINITIAPSALRDTWRQGRLIGLTRNQIASCIGFCPNGSGADDKVTSEWHFAVNGTPCAIWDYKGSHRNGAWSFWGPRDALVAVFGADHVTA